MMDKTKLVKVGLSILGLALSIGSTMISDKMKDAKMAEEVEKKVKEALEK